MLTSTNAPSPPPLAPSAATGEKCPAVHADAATLARLRSRLLSDRTAADLAETFRLLGDPTRVRLLDALAQGELCVCDLAAVVGLSESAVSHQLRLLRGARLVRARRSGRLVFYGLDDRHILTLLEQGSRHVREGAHDAAGVASAPAPHAAADSTEPWRKRPASSKAGAAR